MTEPATSPAGRATTDAADEAARGAAVERALAALDLDTKAALLAGQDAWSLPAVPAVGLRSLVMSDGPVGVRGVRWNPADPSTLLPSPTALAAAWDPSLARRAGRLLAQEARRKGVHVLLAPTVNLHRTPLGGRHFENYSEDPLLTGAVGTGYVRGVQDGGVGTTPKHYTANDSENERFTLDARVSARALRELYLAPFERITADARPWGMMAAYNGVNGPTMTEHRYLLAAVLRGEWGFDGAVVSDWMAARHTERAVAAGLDLAMPGPVTVYGTPLADAVRAGRAAEADVDAAVRRVLRLAARTGALDGAPPAVHPDALPASIDGDALARETARRSLTLLRNERGALPLDPASLTRIAVIGDAAAHARVLGGGSATVFPPHTVSPLDGLRAALADRPGAAGRPVEIVHAQGADPRARLAPAADGFTLVSRYRDASGTVLAELPQPEGRVFWLGELPEGVTADALHSAELDGAFTPDRGGTHTLAVTGYGHVTLTVDGTTVFDGDHTPADGDLFASFMAPEELRFDVELTAGRRVDVHLAYTPLSKGLDENMPALLFQLGHRAPTGTAAELIDEAVTAATGADAAIVVVATTEEVESEGFDRTGLALPGHQDELVRRVAAANPRTVVVVNAGSPVETDWQEDAAAVLLAWFPGQEAGHALADVLLGDAEPGGRLPTTWPDRLADAPVTATDPADGELRYDEGVFIGYRAWQRRLAADPHAPEPAYWFGHGLGYTTWAYESAELLAPGGDDELGAVRVRIRNTGRRPGREVVQVYLAPTHDGPAAADAAVSGPERPVRWLAGFAGCEAAPGETAEAVIPLPRRAAEIWDGTARPAAGADPDACAAGAWALVPGPYTVEVSHSLAEPRLTLPLHV